MDLDFNTLIALCAPVLQTAATAAITTVAIKGVQLSNQLISKIHNDQLRHYVAAQVAAIEQLGKGQITGADKKASVTVAVKRQFPKVPEEVVNMLVEAAVQGLKTALPTPVVIPLTTTR